MLSLVGSQRYAALLRASLGDLLRLALGYMQMTAAQVERWAADPNVYVADEEEDFSTVRCVCVLCVGVGGGVTCGKHKARAGGEGPSVEVRRSSAAALSATDPSGHPRACRSRRSLPTLQGRGGDAAGRAV